jgi:alkanesulfonate monooxygenase SsuD/methylene tetrahydromethanopterin reductase-like flavin-dependent oxidoreductase (luciferase family)
MSNLGMNDFSIMMVEWGREFPTAQGMIEVSQRAEKCGYYSVGLTWLATLPESFWQDDEGLLRGWPLIMENYPGHYLDAIAVLPMIAQATSRIRFGFNAFVVPVLHPFYVAKYLATLDVASGGRVATVFGFGQAEDDGTSRMFEWLGSTIPSKRRGSAAEEALELIIKLWTEPDLLDHEGEFFFGKQMLVEPKPVRKPYPELWWAGERKRSMKMAARYGRYLELHGESLTWRGNRPLERIRAHYGPGLAEANEEWGGQAKLAIQIGARVTDKPVTPAERAELYWFDDRPDNPFHEIVALGSPEQCAEVINALHEAGIEHFVLDFSHEGHDSPSFAMEQVEAWATDVMPLLSETRVGA